MSVKKGSEILRETSNEFELNNSAISFGDLLAKRLRNMVVVPEEQWQRIQNLIATMENVLTSGQEITNEDTLTLIYEIYDELRKAMGE